MSHFFGLAAALVLIGGGWVLNSRAAVMRERADQDEELQALDEEETQRRLERVAGFLGGLNQSYAISPVIGSGSAAGGSYYVDTEDAADGTAAAAEDEAASEADPSSGNTVELPPPLFVNTHPRPIDPRSWLYREVPAGHSVEIGDPADWCRPTDRQTDPPATKPPSAEGTGAWTPPGDRGADPTTDDGAADAVNGEQPGVMAEPELERATSASSLRAPESSVEEPPGPIPGTPPITRSFE